MFNLTDIWYFSFDVWHFIFDIRNSTFNCKDTGFRKLRRDHEGHNEWLKLIWHTVGSSNYPCFPSLIEPLTCPCHLAGAQWKYKHYLGTKLSITFPDRYIRLLCCPRCNYYKLDCQLMLTKQPSQAVAGLPGRILPSGYFCPNSTRHPALLIFIHLCNMVSDTYWIFAWFSFGTVRSLLLKKLCPLQKRPCPGVPSKGVIKSCQCC